LSWYGRSKFNFLLLFITRSSSELRFRSLERLILLIFTSFFNEILYCYLMFITSRSWAIWINSIIRFMKLPTSRCALPRIYLLELISKNTKVLSSKILCLKKLNNLWLWFLLFFLWDLCWFIRLFLNFISKVNLWISWFYKIGSYLWVFWRYYCLACFVNTCGPLIRNASLSTWGSRIVSFRI
jgi:hypothetical protein